MDSGTETLYLKIKQLQEYIAILEQKKTTRIQKEQRNIYHVIQCPDEDCCGCLYEETIGDIICNECGVHYTMLKTVQV